MPDRPATACVREYRTTRQYRSRDHRLDPRRDGSAARSGSSCRPLPCDPSPGGVSGCGKSIERNVAIGLPGVEPGRWKVRTVGAVGIDLRLQAECVVLTMNPA